MSVVGYLLAALFTACLATAELASRYRHLSAARVVVSPLGILYFGVNCLSGVIALSLLRSVGPPLLPAGSSLAPTTLSALLASLLAGLFLRSSVVILLQRGTEISVGPRAFVDAMLGALDRAVDRRRAAERSALVFQALQSVPFETASRYFTQVIESMPGVPQIERQRLQLFIHHVEGDPDLPPEQKVAVLALEVMNLIGESGFRRALSRLMVRDADVPARLRAES